MKHSKLITRTPLVAQGDEEQKWTFRHDMLHYILMAYFNKYEHGTL